MKNIDVTYITKNGEIVLGYTNTNYEKSKDALSKAGYRLASKEEIAKNFQLSESVPEPVAEVKKKKKDTAIENVINPAVEAEEIDQTKLKDELN